MQFQFGIGSNVKPTPSKPLPINSDAITQLLHQMLELQRDCFTQILTLQREQLSFARTKSAESMARWRAILGRYENEQPDFANNCKSAYPILEKTYIDLLASMADDLARNGDEALDSEFAVQEFLDRYAARLGPLSHMLSIVGSLSEAAHQNDQAAKQQEQRQE